ncbi:M20 family metallopeptidase [Verrucomicrobiales bacterium BCK34]|nr:M20 family metallopeptidase [Verrucomicrobiales bacterium BCK34]
MSEPSRIIDTLSDLVRINSINPEWGGPGEGGVVKYLADYFSSCGIEFHEDEVLPGRSNLLARIPGRNSGKAILLEAHMDVVSVDGMTIPPFDPVVEDGKLYGRGSCDTKAGLATMMEALRALHESGEQPPCDVWLAAVVDEEHAFKGVLAAIEWFDKRGVNLDCAVVAEPTCLGLVTTNKGVLRWRIETTGVAAHSSKPHLGDNAISTMAKLINQLDAFHQTLEGKSHPLVGPATCNIGTIRGGDQVNFVPDKCVINLDRRMLPGENADEILDSYRSLLGSFPEEKVKILPADLSDEAMETDSGSAVVRAASRQLQSMGLDGSVQGVPFGCDATKLSRAGIPSIIFGPGSIDQAHAAVEWVDVKEVELAFDFLRGFLLNYEV